MIEARGLTKRYGATVAVDDLSFDVQGGRVTGFLGPNGAGKSTTMRMLLGLDRCDSGSFSFDQKRLVDFAHPPRSVGALLDASYVHPTRKARDHLWAIAASDGIGRWRVLVAKLVVVTAACASIALVMVGFCWVIGRLFVDEFSVDGVDRRAALGIVLFSIGWSAMGMGIGAILRQPIAGILVQLAEAFVVESLVAGIIPSAAKWMPFINGFQMTFAGSNTDGDGALRSVLAGGIYFFAVAASIWAIGAVLATRRDA